MARINVEDQFWTDPRKQYLASKLGCELKAIGACVRFWRLAQEYHKRGKMIPESAFRFAMLPEELFDAEFAVRFEEGIYAKGGEENFAWIKSKIDNGKAGGVESGKARANKNKELTEATVKREASDVKPLTLTLPLTPTQNTRRGGTQNFATPDELRSLAELFAARKIPTELQLLWLKSYSAEYIIEKVNKLLIWEQTAGQKGKKKNWGRFYSGRFGADWDQWIARKPSQPVRTAPGANATAKSEHKAPETNWVTDLQKQGLIPGMEK